MALTRITELVVCPVCHAALSERSGGFTCTSCGRSFDAPAGRLDLTPIPPPDSDVGDRWALWEHLQHNFLVAATEIPEHSLSVGPRADASTFAEFAQLDGLVLDVGCGPQEGPSYALGFNGRFVGIDPTPGEATRSFDFVQGLGEYLPFADRSFDRVLFATSLDHMLSPRRALAEARRVVKADGSVSVWFGVIEADDDASGEDAAPRPGLAARLAGSAHRRLAARRAAAAEPDYLDELEVPDGAIDLFHVEHPDQRRIEGWLREVGLDVAAVRQVASPRSAFIRTTPA